MWDSAALANVSGVVFEQTFNILADGNSSTNTQNTGGITQTTRFNPSMAIIIIVLISAFLFMGFFSIYVRRCTSPDDRNGAPGGQAGQPRNGQHGSAVAGALGLDKAVVESLPLVGYPLLKGLNGGNKDMSECAVCLSDFEDDDNLRVLPKCGHVFHPECVDVWFNSHSTCPLCRASVGPSAEPGKGANDDALPAHESHTGHDHEPDEESGRVPAPGPVVMEDAVTVHGRPPVPPNGSILELLTRDGADRLMVQSLRRENSVNLDRGLSRREETEPIERSGELRALNRVLSKNSSSMQVASKGMERSASVRGDRVNAAIAASAAALLASGTSAYNTGGNNDRRVRRGASSVDSSRSFNFALRRSSSAGSTGGYISKLFGNYGDQESKDDCGFGGDATKNSEADHRVLIENSGFRRERSESELNRIGVPAWVNIDLSEPGDRAGAAVESSPNSARSAESGFWGSRGLNYPGSAGRKYHSGEFPTDAKGVELQGQLSGPLYVRRKGKEAVDDSSTKSERFSFGQSLRRTFSLRRSSSDVKETAATEGSSQQSNNSDSKWWNQMLPSASASAKKLASPIVGAMKGRRPGSSTGDVLPTTSPVDTTFPQSLPILSDQGQQQQHQQQQQQQSTSSSAYPESIQVVSQP